MITINVDGTQIDPSKSKAVAIKLTGDDDTVDGHKVFIFREDTGTFTSLIKEFMETDPTNANELVLAINELFKKFIELQKKVL